MMEVVRVNEGLLEGEEIQNEYGGTYFSFKGIPYAQPPIGDLRFKAPQPVQPWTGVRRAKSFGPNCFQCNQINPNHDNMSEDCLYLNIYTPQVKPSHPLPVMVWIHGGAFICESGDDDYYGPEFLIRQGIVLVTLNYRLGAFGFLCFHTADIPGNAGMKDQVAAIRWVKTNIRNFGGDPDNITIFGENAGAGCVSYHLMSPMTPDLFHRAIVQSGAASCWWSQDFASRDRTFLLAKQLGCFSEDDKEVKDFLKEQPAAALITLKLQILKSQKVYEVPFGIADEKNFGQERFFFGDVTEVLRNNVHEGIEIIIGYTKDEGLMALAFGSSLESMKNEAKYFNEFFVLLWIRNHCVIADQLKVGNKMRQFYFRGGDVTDKGVLRFLDMHFFSYGIILAGNFYSRKNKVYFYKFTCMSDRNIFAAILGVSAFIQDKSVVCHGDDVAYLFPIKHDSSKVDQTSDSFKLINTVTELWTNFAKYGNPTPDKSLGVEWKPYTLQNQEFLNLSNKPFMDTVPQKEELEFWDKIFKEYLPQYIV